MKKVNVGSPPGKTLGTAMFWGAACALMAAPLLPWWICLMLALCAFEVVIYATHEALHIETNGDSSPGLYAPRVIATVGMSFQLQNIEILRLAHLFHHRMGRYGDGWAPDVSIGKATFAQRARYYASLTFLPAVAWQVACLIRPVLPLSAQPYLTHIGYKMRVSLRFMLAWCLVVSYVVYFTYFGGVWTFLAYWVCLCFMWSIQQNIAHYGLTGVDPVTDRVCAHTYYLPRPFSWITYGSTAHFLHHANMQIGAIDLYSTDELKKVEDHLGLTVVPKYGLWPYLGDILRQFRGPVEVSKLTLDWVSRVDRQSKESVVGVYDYRRGRTYVRKES
ncbi:fatty acid desaturase [Amycolatopsis samaneae]|uniref:Fatty acid desaturase n=1 Tax=Amycolatopsis samaneae TaxID=664691 RepID=A0ABW5GI96_9PSEU